MRGRRDSAPPTNLNPALPSVSGQTEEEREEMENTVPMLKQRDVAAKLLVARVRFKFEAASRAGEVLVPCRKITSHASENCLKVKVYQSLSEQNELESLTLIFKT